MKCHICGRDNASIHIREIKDGERKSYYICKECAAKQTGGAGDLMGLAQIIYKLTSGLSGLQKNSQKEKKPSGKKDPFSVDMGIGGIIELFQDKDHPFIPFQDEQKKDPAEKSLRCPFCGWSTEQFHKTNRLGCPECYKVFTEILNKTLPGGKVPLHHTGKHPADLAPELVHEIEEEQKKRLLIREKEELLARMKSDIQSAVVHEDYEKAAFLRDHIWELEKELEHLLCPEQKEKAGKNTIRGRKRKSSSGTNE